MSEITCQICGKPATVHVCEIADGVKTMRAYCIEHATSHEKLPIIDKAGKMFESSEKLGPDAFRAMLGPGQVDQEIRQAIHFCWMMLPSEKRTVDEVESQIRRIVDRALKNLREDGEAFGLPKLP